MTEAEPGAADGLPVLRHAPDAVVALRGEARRTAAAFRSDVTALGALLRTGRFF
jgi:hypothetical protein